MKYLFILLLFTGCSKSRCVCDDLDKSTKEGQLDYSYCKSQNWRCS